MNVSKGLFRAWVRASVLWVVGVGVLGVLVLPETVRREPYQYMHSTLAGLANSTSKVDWNKPFYELMESPSRKKEAIHFSGVDQEYVGDWDKLVAAGAKILIEDAGRLYLNSALNDADRAYIKTGFAAQRWERWGWAALPWVATAFLLPICIFIVGAAALWIRRGFARK